MTGASINEPSCFPVPKGLRGARVDAGRQSIVSLTALELERDISIAKAILAWHRVSSATTANSSLSLYQGPLGGVRLNASALSSAVLTLRTLQVDVIRPQSPFGIAKPYSFLPIDLHPLLVLLMTRLNDDADDDGILDDFCASFHLSNRAVRAAVMAYRQTLGPTVH